MRQKFLIIACAALLMGTASVNAADNRPMPTRERPTPEMMEAKLADRLNLDENQRKAVKERRENDHQQMRALMDKMKEIRTQMDQIRKENMQAFEDTLTPEQKTEFEKIKAERKAHHMERRKMRHMRGEPREMMDQSGYMKGEMREMGKSDNPRLQDAQEEDEEVEVEVMAPATPAPAENE